MYYLSIRHLDSAIPTKKCLSRLVVSEKKGLVGLCICDWK